MRKNADIVVSDATVEDMVERIMQWSNINSGTLNIAGIERLAIVLTDAFSSLHCEASRVSLPLIEQIDNSGEIKKVDVGPLLRFYKRPEAKRQILLVGHMDTVFGIDHRFQQAFRKTANIIEGPGVVDMKGGLSILLESLKLFEKTPEAENLGWEVLINPDEEIGSLASSSYLMERAKHHQVGLVFEPAMDEKGTLAGNRKGSGKFSILVHGRAAHAGRNFHEGRNAITVLAQIVTEIEALNGKCSGITINIGTIQGGIALNIVPALAFCRLDVRIETAEDATWFQGSLESILANHKKREGYKIDVFGDFYRKPKLLTGKTKALFELAKEVAKDIGQDISWKQSGGCSDGNNLSEAGLPNIDTLGASGGNLHTQGEYLLIDSLAPRVQLTTALLIRLNQDGL